MKKLKKLYQQKEWSDFSEKVKRRDGFVCLQCGRGEPEVVIQVHHEIYREDKAPWEYALSDCRTLCRGCHAKEHKLIAPDKGWYLLGIDDLGGLDGICERENCGTSIRYEHLTYHPGWGYKIVGSTCIEHLTQKDQLLSSEIIKSYRQISKFVTDSKWEDGFTQAGKHFIGTKYKHNVIRIYGKDNNYSFQIAIKEPGIRKLEYKKPEYPKRKGLEEVKELAYVVLKGTISENYQEIELLRNVYRSIK